MSIHEETMIIADIKLMFEKVAGAEVQVLVGDEHDGSPILLIKRYETPYVICVMAWEESDD